MPSEKFAAPSVGSLLSPAGRAVLRSIESEWGSERRKAALRIAELKRENAELRRALAEKGKVS